MGRPRAKRNRTKNTPSSPPASVNGASDEHERSKSATPAITLEEAETITEVRESPTITTNVQENTASSSDSTQRSAPWTPSLTASFEQSEMTKTVSDHTNARNLELFDTPMAFLVPDSRMDLDDFNNFLPIDSFLDEISDPLIAQQQIPTPSLDILNPHTLTTERALVRNTEEIFGSVEKRPPPPETTQSWARSNPLHQADATFLSNSASEPNMRVSMGETLSHMSIDLTSLEENIDGCNSSLRGSRISTSTSKSATTLTESASEGHFATPTRGLPVEQDEAYCNCHIVVTDCIVSLKAEQQRSRLIPIDCALKMEEEIEASLTVVHQCKNCRRESSMHLLSLVSVRMMLDMLQKTMRDEFVTRTRRINSSTAPVNNSAILMVGSFKVPARTRCRFLRKIVQARFCRLAILVEKGGKLMNNGTTPDSFSRSGALLLEDISRGLRTTMGWVELWNSKQ